MKSLLSLVSAAILSTLSFNSLANDGAKEGDELDVSAEVGVLVTTGNTESSSYYGNLTVEQNLFQWKNKYTLDLLKKENEVEDANGQMVTQETDDRYTITAQGDYKLSDTSAVFIFGSYTDDEFGAYAKYTTVAAGYSFRPINEDNMFLDVNVGPGYAKGESQDGETESGMVGRFSGAFEWKFSPSAKFIQNVSVEYADFNTRTTTETAVKATLTDMMKMKVGYKTITNSDVDDGLEKTDTETAVTLVVNF